MAMLEALRQIFPRTGPLKDSPQSVIAGEGVETTERPYGLHTTASF